MKNMQRAGLAVVVQGYAMLEQMIEYGKMDNKIWRSPLRATNSSRNYQTNSEDS